MVFTSQNAAQNAAKAHESRRRASEALRKSLEAARNPSDDFREDMVKSVRAQIRLVTGRIDKELERATLDHKALGALAATLSTFESIEQKLSMRAGPGNLKPTAPRTPKGRNAPAAPEPEDVS